jgi:hypothetical protein
MLALQRQVFRDERVCVSTVEEGLLRFQCQSESSTRRSDRQQGIGRIPSDLRLALQFDVPHEGQFSEALQVPCQVVLFLRRSHSVRYYGMSVISGQLEKTERYERWAAKCGVVPWGKFPKGGG